MSIDQWIDVRHESESLTTMVLRVLRSPAQAIRVLMSEFERAPATKAGRDRDHSYRQPRTPPSPWPNHASEDLDRLNDTHRSSTAS